jgi:hypothetical protein
LLTKMKWLCKFLDFCSYHYLFLHLFFSKRINNYKKYKTWSKNLENAHIIVVEVHWHPQKSFKWFWECGNIHLSKGSTSHKVIRTIVRDRWVYDDGHHKHSQNPLNFFHTIVNQNEVVVQVFGFL